jgi:hypothetical protein
MHRLFSFWSRPPGYLSWNEHHLSVIARFDSPDPSRIITFQQVVQLGFDTRGRFKIKHGNSLVFQLQFVVFAYPSLLGLILFVQATRL